MKRESNVRWQLVRYFLVAAIGLAVDFSVLTACAELLTIHYLLSAVFGFIAGLIVNFLLSERHVFDNPVIGSSRVRFALSAGIGLIGLLILTFLMWLFVSVFFVQYLVAKSFATVVVFAWNFIARRRMYQS